MEGILKSFKLYYVEMCVAIQRNPKTILQLRSDYSLILIYLSPLLCFNNI